MGNGGDGTNFLAVQTGNTAGFVNRNRIEWGRKRQFLGTNSYTSPTVNAGIPIYNKKQRVSFCGQNSILIFCGTLSGDGSTQPELGKVVGRAK